MTKWNEYKRSGDTEPLKDVFDKLMRAYQLDKKFNEIDVLSHWEELFGKSVALRTTHLKIENKVLYVSVNSSVIRDEMMHAKRMMILRINETAKFEMINDIYFT